MSYAFKLFFAAAGVIIAGAIAIIVFDELWLQVSLGAAIVVVIGGLLLLTWFLDKRSRRGREGLDELPRV